MLRIISYLKTRKESWYEAYHLRTVSHRLLDDTGFDTGYLSQIRKMDQTGQHTAHEAGPATIKWGFKI